MEDTLLQDALKLEEGNWRNWCAAAEKARDEKLAATAAMNASKGGHQAGGRLREDMRIIFDAIDEVVTKAIALRKTLAVQNPILAEATNLTTLQFKLHDFVSNGVHQVDDRASKTFLGLPTGGHDSIRGLACKEATRIRARIINDLENIPLELKLNPQHDRSPITVHVTGNSGIVNLGSVVGDLNNSVQVLNLSGQKDIADAIEKLGSAIRDSTELKDDLKRDYLEHLTTVSEEVSKPPDKRRVATFLNAVNSVATIGSLAVKIAPFYQSLHALLITHKIIAP